MNVDRPPATVALIRGRALNPFDAQQYPDASRSVSMLAVGARHGDHDIARVPFPVRRLRQLGDGLPRRAQRAIDRRPGLAVGADRLLGLSAAVRDCRILHAAETFQTMSVQAALIRLRDPSRRLVITVWENVAFNWEDGAKLSARKALVRRVADVFVAVTEQAREALILEGVSESRILVRAPGIRSDGFSRERRSEQVFPGLGIPAGAKVILYVGRLIQEKGVLDLLMSLAPLPDDTHLVLVGAGDDRPRLEIAAGTLGLAERIHFADGVDYGDVGTLMASCDVLAVPSLATPYWLEQFGMVLAEGMRSGAPIVAYASGAIPEVVGDAARLVAPYDRAGLSHALGEVLSRPEEARRLSDAGLARGRQRFDAGESAAWWAQFYSELLDPR